MSRSSKKELKRLIAKRKREKRKRAAAASSEQAATPVIGGGNLHYEVSLRTDAIHYGGLGAIHQLVEKLGLAREIDAALSLFKRHLPYHESDHVLTMAYNVATGGTTLDQIDFLREDPALLKALGAARLPDPTTAGDFTRRFDEASILALQEAFNRARERVWRASPDRLDEACIDVDSTLAPVSGGCKQGMDISYNGVWGYHPLLVTLANTRELLYLANRPGNAASQDGAALWIDKALDLVAPHAGKLWLRGDSAFSLTGHFDDWNRRCSFVFGYDNTASLRELAEALPEERWQPLEHPAGPEPATGRRAKPDKVKDAIVRARGFETIRLQSEQVASFRYQPGKCKQDYRIIAVRKNLTIARGEEALIDDIRYFFYITNRFDLPPAKIVDHAHQRCDQENLIQQLKTGIGALRMPVDNLTANWAYSVIACLAWNLKSWFAQTMRTKRLRRHLTRMDYQTFLRHFILIPCQILHQGRRLVYRLLACPPHLAELIDAWHRIRQLTPT